MEQSGLNKMNTPSDPGPSLENTRISNQVRLATPRVIHDAISLTDKAAGTVRQARSTIEAILRGEDSRILAVVGPCSVHDTTAALEYANKLYRLAKLVEDEVVVVMRTYFEKPRTTTGWKGLINDPHLDGSFDMEHGIRLARSLMLSINELGLPVATEALDPFTPQYLGDLVSWSAIGARTTESQTHREMASGLSSPVGMKNGTDGSLGVAINAMLAAKQPHTFLGIDFDGHVSLTETTGNPHSHIILRGGATTNYHESNVAQAANAMRTANLRPNVMVDCSHANAQGDYRRQVHVLRALTPMLRGEPGAQRVFGVMLESNLVEGKQAAAPSGLVYGQSITDACLGWGQTHDALTSLANRLHR